MQFKTYEEAITAIEEWARDRGIDKKGTVEGQFVKTAEEVAELIIGISKDNRSIVIDSLGDVFVTLVVGMMISRETLYTARAEELEYEIEAVFKKNALIKTLVDDLYMLMQYIKKHGGYGYDVSEDMVITLMIIAKEFKISLLNCISIAYNEIANRKGKMIDGQFVKEADLK